MRQKLSVGESPVMSNNLVCFANKITFPHKIITLTRYICIWEKRHSSINLNKRLLWLYLILKATP